MSAEPSNISNVSNTSNTSNTDSDAPGGGSTALAAQTALEGFALPAGTTHAQLFAALQASSARTPPACRLLGTFRDGVNDEELVERGEEEKGEKGEEEEKRNRMALCCPRSGCGSTVLLKGTAKLVRGVWIPVSNLILVVQHDLGPGHDRKCYSDPIVVPCDTRYSSCTLSPPLRSSNPQARNPILSYLIYRLREKTTVRTGGSCEGA
jgi:hypothetical protein